MKRSGALVSKMFVAILAVSLGTVLATGFSVRWALQRQFESYLGHLPAPRPMMGRGAGRMLLGTAEQQFLAGVDRSIIIAAAVAVVLAAVAAWVLARHVARPLGGLKAGALQLASGDLSHRVDIDGPDEVVELAEAFNEMADSLGEAENLRKRLVQDVSHELRNPVAALRAQLEGVAEGVIALDPARAASLVDDVQHLSRLVNDLQELSLAEAGRLSYEPTQFDLSSLVEQELRRVELSSATGVTLSTEGERGITVMADELRLAQVIRNMLANAVRHTAAGSVIVVLGRTPDGVRVEVRDTGEGIPADDLPYVFERFYRADAARAARTGGAGLGLAIARRIVQDHGGRVFASSEPGVLTVVGFEIPASGTRLGIEAKPADD